MIKAYWIRIVVFSIVGAFIALAASVMMPKKYEAIVEIMIDQSVGAQVLATNRQSAATDPLLAFSRSRNIMTQVEQLQSLGVVTTAAQAVADKMQTPQAVQDPNGELNPVNLQHAISISADSTSDIIDLRVRMSKADLAQDVAQQLYSAFQEQNEQNSKALATRAIASLDAQAKTIDKQLKDIDRRSQDLRAKVGMPDAVNQVAAEVNGLSQMEQARDLANIEAAGAHRQVEVLAAELTKIPKSIPQSSTVGPDPIYQQLQRDLMTAKSERALLLARYLPDNDQVKAKDEQIASIQTQIKQARQESPSGTQSGPNPAYQTLQTQLANARASADGADQKLHAAEAKVAERKNYMKTLPPITTELMGLQREQQALEKIYFGYQDDLKTLQAAKQGTTSPAQEITPATSFPDPVSPKPLVNTIFGALIGLLLGVGSMLYTEAKRQPVRSLAQLNGLSLKPVYRLIPELREPFRGLQKAPPEAFESLLANYLRSATRPYRIAVVGVNKDAGASTTALNLAIAGSRHGSNVLLVECDQKGALNRVGVKDPKQGELVEILPLVKATAVETALSSGEHQSGFSPALANHESDLTIIDLEPATASAEYAFLAPYVQEVVLLVRAGRSRSVEFLQVQQALRDAGCQRVTVAFTRSSDFSVVVDAVETEIEEEGTPVAVLPTYIRHPAPVEEAPSVPEVKAAPEAPAAATRVVEAPVAVAPVAAPEVPAEVFPVAAPVSEPKPTFPKLEPDAPQVSAAEGEAPVRRTRSTPSVSIEDFGGISRAKAPEPKEPAKPEKEEPKARRSRVDTSSIDS